MTIRAALAIALAGPVLLALAVGCGGEDRATGPGAEAPVSVPAETVLRRDPHMGVSCRAPNPVACDRIGLAVWLREPAVSVRATIGNREFELDDPDWSRPPREYAGFLAPAGLRDGEGPLEAKSAAASGPLAARERVPVGLRIVGADGTTRRTAVELDLGGWG